MRVLLIDQDVVGLDFALRCKKWGHDVRWFIPPENGKIPPTGDGFGIKKIDDFRDSLEWGDIIIPTINKKYIRDLTSAREEGAPVFGPSVESAGLENDREIFMEMLKEMGLPVLPFETFSNGDFDGAIALVEKEPDMLVSKPFSSEDKALSYVAHNKEDMLWRLNKWKDSGKKFGTFVIQRKVDGAEIGVSRFIGSKGWVGPVHESFEFKKLMPGDYGPTTGEVGTIQKYVGSTSKLFETWLKPFESLLLEINHTGDFAIGGMIEKQTGKPWIFECSARLGWPEFFGMCCQHIGDPVQWMWDALQGRDTLRADQRHQAIVLLWLDDFPWGKVPEAELLGRPIQEIRSRDLEQIHFVSVMAKDRKFFTTDSYLMAITGFGTNAKDAAEAAFSVAEKIKVPGALGLRNDIGRGPKFRDRLKVAQSYGYGRDFKAN